MELVVALSASQHLLLFLKFELFFSEF